LKASGRFEGETNLTPNGARGERPEAAIVSKMPRDETVGGSVSHIFAPRSRGLVVRQPRRLNGAAFGPAIQVLDDFLMARAERLWRAGFPGRRTWQLEWPVSGIRSSPILTAPGRKTRYNILIVLQYLTKSPAGRNICSFSELSTLLNELNLGGLHE
jgi:hypothetical protein